MTYAFLKLDVPSATSTKSISGFHNATQVLERGCITRIARQSLPLKYFGNRSSDEYVSGNNEIHCPYTNSFTLIVPLSLHRAAYTIPSLDVYEPLLLDRVASISRDYSMWNLLGMLLPKLHR